MGCSEGVLLRTLLTGSVVLVLVLLAMLLVARLPFPCLDGLVIRVAIQTVVVTH